MGDPTTSTSSPTTATVAGHDAAGLSDRLAALLGEFDVPGAAFAFARGDEMVTGAAGVLSRATGYPATADSFFQIGSITKVFTATLVMQLVDEGRVDLFEPVRTYLPEFDVGDEVASATITVRHLLTHTSGIQGDYFRDFGRGDDAVARYVASLADLTMLHRPGELVSYCNSGFIVLGLLLERLRESDYGKVLTQRLLQPLAIVGGTLPEQAILHRAAIGHVADPDGTAGVPAPQWALPYCAGPAGSTPFMDPAGLVAFARMHLVGGLAPDGTRLLSEDAVAEMQRMYAPMSAPGSVDGIGSSWVLYRYGDDTVPGHDGGTLGQYSFLRVHPPTGTIAVLLTNGPGGGQLFDAFAEPVFTEIAGLPEPVRLAPVTPAPHIDAARLVGRYQHYGMDLVVAVTEGKITVTTDPQPGPDATDADEPQEIAVVPHSFTDESEFLVTEQLSHGSHQCVMFPAANAAHPGPPNYLRMGSRVFARARG